MAWVRRVRTASGATAVQIAEYVDGRRRIVAHLGSAHTEAELGLLLEQGRSMLADIGQAELDLGLEPARPKRGLVTGPRPAGNTAEGPVNDARPRVCGHPLDRYGHLCPGDVHKYVDRLGEVASTARADYPRATADPGPAVDQPKGREVGL